MVNPPLVPLPADDDESVTGTESDQATREVDGEEVLDADADDTLMESADADRLASGGDTARES